MKKTFGVRDFSSLMARLVFALIIGLLSPGFEAYSAFARTLELKDSAAQTRVLGDGPTETGRIQTDITGADVPATVQDGMGEQLERDLSESRSEWTLGKDNHSQEAIDPEIQLKTRDEFVSEAAAAATLKTGSGLVAAEKGFSLTMRRILTSAGRAVGARSPDSASSEMGTIYGDRKSAGADVADDEQTSGRFSAWRPQLLIGRASEPSSHRIPNAEVSALSAAAAPSTMRRPMVAPSLTTARSMLAPALAGAALAGLVAFGLPDILHAATAAQAAVSGSASSIDPIMNGIAGAVSGIGSFVGNGLCYIYPATIAYQQISGKAKPDEKSPWRIFLGIAGSALLGGISSPLEHMQEGSWATFFWGVQNWTGILLLMSPPLVANWLKKTGTAKAYQPIGGKPWEVAAIRDRLVNDAALRRTAMLIAIAAGAAAVISMMLHYFIVPAIASWHWGVPLGAFGPIPQSVSGNIDAIRENIQWVSFGLYFAVFFMDLIQRALGKKIGGELPPGYASLYTGAMIGMVLWNASEAYLIGHKLASEGVPDWMDDHGWRQKIVYAVQSIVIGVSSYISYRLQPKRVDGKVTAGSVSETAGSSMQAGKNALSDQKRNKQAGPSALKRLTPPDPWELDQPNVILA